MSTRQMDALCHTLEERAATALHCSPEHAHEVMVEALAAQRAVGRLVPVGSLARRAVIAAGDIGRGALALAQVRHLHQVVADAERDSLIDHTAAVRLADAIDQPQDREARRGGLLELARHAEQWTEDTAGVGEVALLRDRLAPACSDALWDGIVHDAAVASRETHDLEDVERRARAEADLEFALARALEEVTP